ncbi:MAG: zinc ribbon domain-containing protein [Candidatus Poseidoniaceae archaeon]|nr:zinc ribbon domain-containing protein [Candidatus Poseidoniaceae archaeon]
MQCGSCIEVIPDDSIFCPECGSRQELSRAGAIPGVGNVGLSGQQVAGGRNFGVVSGEAVIQQNAQNMGGVGMPPGMMPDLMGQIAQGMQPGQMPPNPELQQGMPPLQGEGPFTPGGISVSQNPSLSPTDAMVNRIAEAERQVKNERRSQWLQMNQESAANVLSSIGGELPSHLRGGGADNSAADFLESTIGGGKGDAGNEALYRRMSEVAVRRVARKRGVAVETPQIKLEGGLLNVNVTYVDDGRVLDTPGDLSSAFEHAISTEIALKGMDAVVEISLFRSKDGSIEKVIGPGIATPKAEPESDEEMFACEVCEGLVKESDNTCPHCGAMFEDEDAPGPSGGGPPKRGGPPGPSRGGPPGPSRGGPPKRGGPSGPSGGGPPKRGGPPGPSGGGPPKRGGPPGGPKRGPPGGPKRSPPN